MMDSHWALVIVAGVVVGIFVGMVGTSGAIMIPMLVYGFGLTQLRAQGTSIFIAAIPVWIAPLLPYARAHQVDWRLGLLLAVGLAAGGYFGAQAVQQVPVLLVRRSFAVVLAAVALRMFFGR